MAGHSHWSQIKRAKGAADVKRGQLFSKLSREITVAAKMGGGDPSFNPRLRTAIQTAKAESMPAENIERAIKKGTGELEGVSYEELTYEGYGPAGVALLVETLSDNRNRTAQQMRAIFTRGGGNLGATGAVSWMFKKKGWFRLEGGDEEKVMEATLDANPEDIAVQDGAVEVFCAPENYELVEKSLKAAGLEPGQARLSLFAENLTPVADLSTARQVLDLVEALEEHDDVQRVHTNADISPELVRQLSAGGLTP
ncbi:MAG: YebC/PmpR family DNA-binding transcriptional regulator [Candidatus Methylacidiphilales bacterium]|nr:YebC/PmpR family DNA-binding transcriptional regulator [Candidatus Methylacidiphilales bacterium]